MKNSKYFILICQRTQIYTQLVEITFKHIVSKSMKKINTTWKKSFFPKVLSKHASRPFHWLTTYFGKIEKKISIKLKNIIYTRQWHQYTHHWLLKKNTFTTILLEDCATKQRELKLKFKGNQKITWKLERKFLN